MSQRGRIRVGALAAGPLALALLAGCGGGSDFADQPRPPAQVQLTGVITSKGVTVSPNKVGAGPVVILVSNQTDKPHTLTLSGGANAPVHTAPIAPTDTGRIQATLARGTYTVKAGSSQAVPKELAPARLVIGAPRPDSNDQVGLP